MIEIVIALGAAGLLLFGGGPLLARWAPKGVRDPMAVGRLLQLCGVVLLLFAVALRPHNPATAAFPPPPDEAASAGVRDGAITRTAPGGSVRDAAFRALGRRAAPSG